LTEVGLYRSIGCSEEVWGCKAFDRNFLWQTAIRGSRCLPSDPSSAS